MGVRGIGASCEAAFEQAALALTAVITDPAAVAGEEMVEIECEAPDVEFLFAYWQLPESTRWRPAACCGAASR